MQSKITSRHYFTSSEMTTIKRIDHTKCWQGGGAMGHCYWECKVLQPLWKTAWKFLKKWNIHLPCVPAIVLLGILLKRVKKKKKRMTVHSNFIVVAKNYKWSKYPSVGEWIKKKWYIHTIICHRKKREQSIETHNIEESQNNFTEWEKQQQWTYWIIPYL